MIVFPGNAPAPVTETTNNQLESSAQGANLRHKNNLPRNNSEECEPNNSNPTVTISVADLQAI